LTFEKTFLCYTILWYFKQEGIQFEQKRITDEIKRYICSNMVILTDPNNNSLSSLIVLEKLFEMNTMQSMNQELK
jgi:hypothetical protein